MKRHPPPIPHRLQAPYRRWNLQGGLRGSNSGNFISNLGSDPPGQKGTKGSEPTALTCCDSGSSSDFRGCGDPPPTSQLGLPDEGRGRGRHRGAHVPSSSGTPPTALLYLRPDSSVKRGHSRCSSVRGPPFLHPTPAPGDRLRAKRSERTCVENAGAGERSGKRVKGEEVEPRFKRSQDGPTATEEPRAEEHARREAPPPRPDRRHERTHG